MPIRPHPDHEPLTKVSFGDSPGKPDAGAKKRGKTLKNCVIISDWVMLLKILRLFGTFPVQLVNKVGGNDRDDSMGECCPRIEYHFKSWVNFYSFGACAIRLGTMLYFLACEDLLGFEMTSETELYLKTDHRNDTSAAWLPIWAIKCIDASLPVYKIWALLCAWLVLGNSVKLVNNWVIFEEEFREIFPLATINASSGWWRRAIVTLAVIPSGVVVIVAYSKALAWNLQNLAKIVSITFIIYSFALEEAQALLSYRTITEAFRNVRRAIREEMDGYDPGQALTMAVVLRWEGLLRRIRGQVKLTGAVQAPSQIVLIILAVILFTQSLYLFLVGFIQCERVTVFIWTTGFMSASHVIRILMKVLIADRISLHEEKLLDELLRLSPRPMELDTKLELKKITDIVIQRPSKISLSGFVTLEIRLIPQITSYILAYLVVLIQFHMSINFAPQSGGNLHLHA